MFDLQDDTTLSPLPPHLVDEQDELRSWLIEALAASDAHDARKVTRPGWSSTPLDVVTNEALEEVGASPTAFMGLAIAWFRLTHRLNP